MQNAKQQGRESGTFGKTYPSGLRLVVKRMEGLLSVSMGVLVGTGSSLETAAENGVSHFLEHMMFKGTDKRTAFAISDAMDRIGAQVNAFTSKELTCYYAKATSDHAGEAFEILSDFVLHSVFPPEELEREKGVVLEEIAMTEDTPDDLCLDVLSEAYFGQEGYGRTILGPAENVKGFTREDLFAYVRKRYAPENLVVSFAGNISEEAAEELVETYFASALERRALEPRTRVFAPRGGSLLRVKDIEQAHISFAFPAPPRDHALADAALVANIVLGGGMSSRLFQRVREQLGLAYTVYSYLTAYEEGGMLTVYAGVNPANVERAQEAIFETIEGFAKELPSDAEFARGKEQLKSSLILGQESTASQMIQYGKRMLFNGDVLDFSGRIARIDAMTQADIADAVALCFAAQPRAAAVVGKVENPLKI